MENIEESIDEDGLIIQDISNEHFLPDDISFPLEMIKNTWIANIRGAGFENAYQDLHYLTKIIWPNNTYWEFIELISKHQISNKADNNFLKFFNKYSNLETSPLSTSVSIGKEFVDNTLIPHNEYKVMTIWNNRNQTITLWYRPLVIAIKSLMTLDSINESLVLKYRKKICNRKAIFEEQYNCNW